MPLKIFCFRTTNFNLILKFDQGKSSHLLPTETLPIDFKVDLCLPKNVKLVNIYRALGVSVSIFFPFLVFSFYCGADENLCSKEWGKKPSKNTRESIRKQTSVCNSYHQFILKNKKYLTLAYTESRNGFDEKHSVLSVAERKETQEKNFVCLNPESFLCRRERKIAFLLLLKCSSFWIYDDTQYMSTGRKK